MADDVTVNIDVHAHDFSSTQINNITENVVHLHQAVQQEERQESRWEKTLQRVRQRAVAAARATLGMAANVAKLAAVTGPAVSGLLAAGKAVAVFGKSLANLLPLVAFLPSLIGSLKLITATAKLMGPGFKAAFEPITSFFQDADGNASAFTKRLQAIAGIGLRPLAEQFRKVNLPAISDAMAGIAYQLNGIVYHTLRWLNTTTGQSLISKISLGTKNAMESLTPHVLRLVYAFGALAEKAGDKAIKGLADTLGRLLDKISTWAEQHDLDDINAALSDLAGYGVKIRQVFGAVRDVGRWLAENESKIKQFSDVAAGAAIALGVATGNVPAVVAGSVSLIINHWNDLKSTFSGSGSWVSDVVTRWKNDAGRIKVAESLINAWNGFREQFARATGAIGPQWREFISELKAAWDEWAPLIAAWWNTGGREAFKAAGLAIGIFVMGLLSAATTTAQVASTIAKAFKFMVSAVLDALGLIISGAAKAFSWIPGMGPKLNAAAAAFEDFKRKVNNSLDGIESMKTIRINASVYVTGGGSVAGGVDQRTGNSRNAGLSGLTSWQRVAEAFAGGSRDTSRTGGPTPLTASVQNTIMLDGKPFRSYTDRVVMESERRARWRARQVRTA